MTNNPNDGLGGWITAACFFGVAVFIIFMLIDEYDQRVATERALERVVTGICARVPAEQRQACGEVWTAYGWKETQGERP